MMLKRNPCNGADMIYRYLYFGVDVSNMNIRQINCLFRDHDESHKWPICGEFNATERAIRRVRKYTKDNGAVSSSDYAYMLEQEISDIVNHYQ